MQVLIYLMRYSSQSMSSMISDMYGATVSADNSAKVTRNSPAFFARVFTVLEPLSVRMKLQMSVNREEVKTEGDCTQMLTISLEKGVIFSV